MYFIVNLFGFDSAHPELFETWNTYGIKIQFVMRGVRVFGQIFATGYITNVLITVIKNNIENKFFLV